MPIPPCNEDGFLQPGVHDCSLEELRERFGMFDGTDRRRQLFDALSDYAEEARNVSIVGSMIVDGSFVTVKQEPEDIDLILVTTRAAPDSELLRPFEYNVVSRRMVRRRHPRLDVFVSVADSQRYHDWVETFSQVKDRPDRTKGMVRILL
ncbi:MAG: hypothetical protein O3A46_00670 [Candidatus Poribacteria bacterium]|nr:hypothetical protein [Candidatus Poribacteria bacterium]